MHDIFEKIIKRELPAYIVYEDDIVLAFLDIKPINLGQTLIAPKIRFKNILDGDTETLAHMMKIAQKIAKLQISELGANGVNILMNNEPAAGQEIFHAHLKVIPRKTEDKAFQEPSHTDCTPKELEETKNKLADLLK